MFGLKKSDEISEMHEILYEWQDSLYEPYRLFTGYFYTILWNNLSFGNGR